MQLYYNIKFNGVLPIINIQFQANPINYNLRNPEEINVNFPRTDAVLISLSIKWLIFGINYLTMSKIHVLLVCLNLELRNTC